MTTAAQQIEAAPGAEPGADAPPFAPALVEEMLRHLARTVRTRQLYLPNNPIYQRAAEGLSAAFEPIWAETGAIVLAVHEGELRWHNVVVAQDAGRGDSLPWTLYKDGIRELTLLRGVEEHELGTLLDILQRVRKASPEEDDLITLLWAQEFLFLRYRYVDAALDGLASEMDLAPVGDSPASVPNPRSIAQDVASAPVPVRMGSFDTTLYFLDDPDIEYLRAAMAAEYTGDLGSNVAAILLDIFEVQTDSTVRSEVLDSLDQLMLYLLTTGNFRAVANLLSEADVAATRATELQPAHADALRGLARRLGEPTALSELLRAMDEGAIVPREEELVALFGQLGAGTLGVLLSWLGRLQRAELRGIVERTAERLASANTAELVQLIGSPDTTIAAEAIRRSGALRTPAAIGALTRVLGGQGSEMRAAAASALADIGSPGALRALEEWVDDPERDVRLIALRTLGARGQRSALPRLDAMMRSKLAREADRTEKLALFTAFAALAGPDAVPLLDSMLNGRSIFLRREDAEVRACAAMALGQIGGERARQALAAAAEDRDIVVRNAANRGLRGGEP